MHWILMKFVVVDGSTCQFQCGIAQRDRFYKKEILYINNTSRLIEVAWDGLEKDGKNCSEDEPTAYVVDNDDYETGIAIVGYRLQATKRSRRCQINLSFILKFY